MKQPKEGKPKRPLTKPSRTAAPRGQREEKGFAGSLKSWRPRFVLDIVSELRKVTWPTRQDTVHLTVVVVVVTLAIGALLGAIDIGFGWLIDHTLLR